VSTIDEPVKKVATVLTVSDELFEDAVQVQTYLNSRLTLFVRLEEERQLLRGGGTNELVGVFGRSGINTYTKAAADDNATALAKVLANTAGSAFLMPDTIICHPTTGSTPACSGTAPVAPPVNFSAAARSRAPTATVAPSMPDCSGRASGTRRSYCRTTSALAPPWSATSARGRRSSAVVARPSRLPTVTPATSNPT
jgi:Phage capsid family